MMSQWASQLTNQQLCFKLDVSHMVLLLSYTVFFIYPIPSSFHHLKTLAGFSFRKCKSNCVAFCGYPLEGSIVGIYLFLLVYNYR